MIRLDDTSGAAVAAAIGRERSRLGTSPSGMVLTLLILASEETQAAATTAAISAARLHPMRILTLIPRPLDSTTCLDAEISVGGDDGPGEVAVVRLRGGLAEHANSVAIPLLLSDTPVVAYWPGLAPAVPADDLIGQHGQRRITDAAAASDPMSELLARRSGYRSGDTDLAWTRLTTWRSALAAALDRPIGVIDRVEVSGDRSNPGVPLLTSWLRSRLAPTSVTTTWESTRGVSTVVLHSSDGTDLTISRINDAEAILSRSGSPDSQIFLPQNDLAGLISEELRRLDSDEAYAQALEGIQQGDLPPSTVTDA